MTDLIRKIFSRLGFRRSNQTAIPHDAKHIVVTTGTVVSIQEGPHGVYAIVLLHEPRNHKATFLVEPDDPEEKSSWQHGHHPHVREKVRLYGLRPTSKRRRWFAKRAERY